MAGCNFLCLLSLSRVKFLLKESQEILSSSLRLPIRFLSQILDTYSSTRPLLSLGDFYKPVASIQIHH